MTTEQPQNGISVSGGMYIGSMSGGTAQSGDHAQVVTNPQGSTVSTGGQTGHQVLAAGPQLLADVARLREQLPLLAADADGVAEADAGLAELERTGEAERGRLARLLELLTVGGSAVAALGAAAPVVQGLQGLLGLG
ncbi:hypothetical protein [Streptomyces sp. GSL17-111]|uniref:hypothetical protein n=1 Tax=Streptomyces sp. GSL17-111 TaxID=3121596 RepID=UPI0030F49CD0